MAIQALEKFKEKYPAYADKSDEELANALSTKYPDAYGELPKLVSRQAAISEYNPMTQRSAELAMDRPDMKRSFAEETQYNPLEQEELTDLQKARQLAVKPASLAIKGLGAAGQTMESALSGPVVATQRLEKEKNVKQRLLEGAANIAFPGGGPSAITSMAGIAMDPEKRGEWLNTVRKSISGEEPTEYGDVYRNIGIPEPIAATLGLGTAMLEPGMQELVKGASVIRNAVGKTVSKVEKNVAQQAARIHLNILSAAKGGGREAVDVFVKDPANVVKNALDPQQVEKRLEDTIDTIRDRVVKAQKSAGEAIEDVTKIHGDKIVQASSATGEKVTANTLQRLLDDSLIEKVGKKGNIRANKIEGVNELLNIVRDVERDVDMVKHGGRGNLKLDRVRWHLKRVRALASDKKSPVYAHANGLYDDLTSLYDNLSDKAAKVDLDSVKSAYSQIRRLREGDKLTGRGSVDELIKVSASGKTKLSNYFSLGESAKASMQQLDDILPEKLKFMDELKASSAANIFKSIEPIKGTSLLGLVTVLYRPQMIPGVAAASVLTSPRLAALGHYGIRAAKEKLAASPVMQGIEALLGRGIDLGMITAPRKGTGKK